jgi:uncharacterized protein YdhG (YjbR/CyaY superfamily)
MNAQAPPSVEAYLAALPPESRALLEQLRATVREALPSAEECINYGIPTFKLKGNLLHYAAYEGHIGFYPAPSGIEAFREAFSGYKQGKGSVQFPLDQPLPLELIRQVALFRAEENLSKAAAKRK